MADKSKIRVEGLASIKRRCAANAAIGWRQDDSLGVLQDALGATALAADEQLELLSLMRDHKLFNPSQAYARFRDHKLLPAREVRKRGSADSAASELAD